MNTPDTVRVHLYEDDTLSAQFDTLPYSCSSEADMYEVPAEQLQRWENAQDAWLDVQAEIKTLMSARSTERIRQRAEAREREDKRRAEIRRDLYGRAEEERKAYTAARVAAVQTLRSEQAANNEADGFEAPLRRATTSLLLTILDRPSPFDLPAPIVRVAPGTCREASFGWIHVQPSCRCPR